MDVIVEIAKLCLEKPISGAFKEVRYAMGKKSLIKSLEKMKTTIQSWLVDANSAHLTSQAERLAVEQLICALDELRDLLDGIATRELIISTHYGNDSIKKVLTRLFSPSLNPVVSSFKDVHRIRAFIEALDNVARPHSQLGSMLGRPFETAISPRQPRCLETGPLSSEIAIGRDVDRDNVIRLLFNSTSGLENISVVSIVGIGGMGKTTLAQCVFNDERVQTHFDITLWVHVPQELVAEDVMRKMVELGTDENINETAQLTQLQYRLHPIISSKKYLLVIDNIWDHNLNLNWPTLMQQLGFGGRGSMVLTTTRSLRVAKTIGNIAPYMLGDLDDDESWRLFKIHAFRHAQQQEAGLLKAIGKQIVGKCLNVPLVIRSVGCHLGGHNQTIRYWEDFKDKLDSLGRCDGFPDVLETLKLTYDDLDYWLKRCFACCSLFPKGCELNENRLIYLWIGFELVEIPSDRSKSLVDVAKYYIHCLKEEGLLIPCEYEDPYGYEHSYLVRMHDVIHDLALSIGGSKYKMVYSENQEVDERIEHISFTAEAKLSGNFPCSSIHEMKKQIQSLLLLPMVDDSIKLILKGVSCFKRLKVLGLRKAGLEEVPRTIGELQLLRYLDLSKSPEIKKLPRSITKLVNLVYLNLNCCIKLEELPVDLNKLQKLICLELRRCSSLRKLPRGITKLVKLRELYLEGCWNLRHMPLRMRNMASLQRLDLFVDRNECDFDDEVGGLAELNCLNNLEGNLRIKVHGSSTEAKAAHLLGKNKLTTLFIEFKGVRNRERDEMMLEGFQPCTNLKMLQISGYGGGRLPSWIDNGHNVEEIRISNWEVGHICVGYLGRLPNLKILIINGCETIESSGSNSVTATAFPNLKDLSLYNVAGLEIIPEEFKGISSLQHLRIGVCKQLKELPVWIDTLTTLKTFFIGSCPKLTALPNQMAKLLNLEFLVIQSCPNLKGIPCFPKLKFLFLNNMGIEFVPNFFKGLSSIQVLCIDDCQQLKELPEWVDTFTSLGELIIINCPTLTYLPKQMTNLKNLQKLNILGNCSDELQERCQKITDLILQSLKKQIQSLLLEYRSSENAGKLTLKGFSDFKRLKKLGLERAGLKEVPRTIGELKLMRYLDLSNNSLIKKLSRCITKLVNLVFLNLNGCYNLEELPVD